METEEQKLSLEDLKPFNQYPTWAEDAEITMTGKEFESVYNLINIFSPAVASLNSCFQRNVNQGIITIKNEYTDGTEVPEEEMRRYYEILKQVLTSQQVKTDE